MKIRDFTHVNERFQKWRNEEIGLYRRTLVEEFVPNAQKIVHITMRVSFFE